MTDPIDPTDNAMMLDSNHEVICFKNEWIRRGLENVCGCERCRNENGVAGLPDKAMGVLRDDLATNDESTLS